MFDLSFWAGYTGALHADRLEQATLGLTTASDKLTILCKLPISPRCYVVAREEVPFTSCQLPGRTEPKRGILEEHSDVRCGIDGRDDGRLGNAGLLPVFGFARLLGLLR
jgi:hypothetical protein